VGTVTVCPPYSVDSKLIQDMDGYDFITDASLILTKQMLVEWWVREYFCLIYFRFFYFPFSIPCIIIQLLLCGQHNAHTLLILQCYYNVSELLHFSG